MPCDAPELLIGNLYLQALNLAEAHPGGGGQDIYCKMSWISPGLSRLFWIEEHLHVRQLQNASRLRLFLELTDRACRIELEDLEPDRLLQHHFEST